MKVCIKTYKSENSTIHERGRWAVQLVTHTHSTATHSTILPSPLRSFFLAPVLSWEIILLLASEKMNRRNFDCFQANRRNFRSSREQRLNTKLFNPPPPPIPMRFLVLLSFGPEFSLHFFFLNPLVNAANKWFLLAAFLQNFISHPRFPSGWLS